jgi:hypothetical protein
MSETPRVYEFQYATSYRTREGLEWIIVAKSLTDLEKAWISTAPVTAVFDPNMVSMVSIRRPTFRPVE